MSRDVVILAGARTPMLEYVGAFKDVSALELGARLRSSRQHDPAGRTSQPRLCQ